MVVGVVVVSFDGRVFERPVHAFDLAVGPRVPWLGKLVVDVGLRAPIFEGMDPRQLAFLNSESDVCGDRADVPGRGDVCAIDG